MKNTLKIEFNSGLIIMDRTFAKYAAIVGSSEYEKLQSARRDYPTFSVVKRTIKKNPNKECYRGLTYDYMRDYILSHSNGDKTFHEFNELLLLSKCHSIRYPAIKQWFLETYPEIAEYNTKRQEDNETRVA